MNQKSILSLFLGLSLCKQAQAQVNNADTLIKPSTIEITQIYRPKVKQSIKPFYTPNLPPKPEMPSGDSYDIPQFKLDYAYKATPLQALAIAPDTNHIEYKKYVKAGFGNRGTIYLDAGAGNLYTKNTRTNIHLGFLNQKGAIDFQKQTQGALQVNTDFKTEKLIGGIQAEIDHQKYYQYGYDHDLYPAKTAAAQSLTGGRIHIDLKEARPNRMGFVSLAQGGLSFYSGSRLNNELGLHLGIGLQKQLSKSLAFETFLKGNTTQMQVGSYDTNNAYVSLNIGLRSSNSGAWQYHAFIAPTLGQGGNALLLQDLGLSWKNNKTNLSAGSKGRLTQNTYSQQFFINPFIAQFQSVQSHSNEVYIAISQGLGHHLHFDAKLGWWQYEHFATYLNDFSSGKPEEMMIAYVPKMNAIETSFKLRYQIGESLSVGGRLSIFNYYNQDKLSTFADNKVWHIPNTQLQGDVIWAPIKPLVITGYGRYLGGNFAYDAVKNEVLSIPAVFDIGLGGEYLAIKNLSFFLNCDNLLNNKNQRWLGYQAYGINIYGGARLKF